jgi:hypothetical protein
VESAGLLGLGPQGVGPGPARITNGGPVSSGAMPKPVLPLVAAVALVGAFGGTAWAAGPSDVALGHKEASEINLNGHDMPGWHSSPDADTPQSKADARRLALCVGAPDPAKAIVTHINSPSFDKGNLFVNSGVALVATKSDAQRTLAAMRSNRVDACLQKELPVLEKQVAPAKVLKLGVTDHLHAPWLPSSGFGYRLEVVIKQGKVTATAYTDAYGFTVGRTQVELSVTYQGGADTALEAQLGKLLVKRTDKFAH